MLLGLFDGTLILLGIGFAVGVFVGWFVPQPKFIKDTFPKDD